jgi:acyl-CoA thioester hydrolase
LDSRTGSATEVTDSPSAGRFDGRTHVLPVRVYYEDTVFSGVVYHASYLRFLERGRSDLLRMAGISHQEMLAEQAAFAVSHMQIAFRRPARIDDALVVATSFDAVRGPRLVIAQSVKRGEEELVSAEVEACCISLDGRPRRPTAQLLHALGPFRKP